MPPTDQTELRPVNKKKVVVGPLGLRQVQKQGPCRTQLGEAESIDATRNSMARWQKIPDIDDLPSKKKDTPDMKPARNHRKQRD